MSTDRSPSSFSRLLNAYFRSGWAFFIPYLSIYLIYYWQKWQANPPQKAAIANALLGGGHRLSSFLPSLKPPPLLYVYWMLHAIHAALAAVALLAWWKYLKRKASDQELNDQLSTEGFPHTAHSALTSAPDPRARRRTSAPFYPTLHSAATALAPWFLLTLVFYIPGVYLEWPADPWEHFHRITEWATHDFVGSHSAGYKSLYFFAYSFVAGIPVGGRLFRLNVYYTGMCLLLAWQYYLLAKAVGLDRRWAFLSVVLNVLTFGNVCFSFYRYYGLSSTILAQIGAVALARVAILAARGANGKRPSLPNCPIESMADHREQSHGKMRLALMLMALCPTLLALIAYNHVQGLGIAGLSIGSIAVWRLIEWRRSMIFLLSAGALALSVAAVLWWPRHPLIDSVYRPGGWLNAWYGFNLFAWPSPAADRAMQIFGLFGIMNLAAGIALLRRNHVVGWLTVGPLIGLGLPFVAIPFCGALARNAEAIFVFHRMLFAIPSGLSLTLLAATAAQALEIRLKRGTDLAQPSPGLELLRFGGGLIAVVALVLIPANGRSLNRLWHTLAIQADDLDMAALVKFSGDPQYEANNHVARILCAPGAGFVQVANGASNIRDAYRLIDTESLPSARAESLVRSIGAVPNDGVSGLLVVPQAKILTSTQSLAAFLSRQWLPNEAALEYVGGPESEAAALASGYRELPSSNIRLYLYQPPRKTN